MSNDNVKFLNLFKQKKYSEILSIIDNQIKNEDKNAGLLNLSGVCRMMIDGSNESIKLAIEDFKNSCSIEQDKNKLFDPFKNLINASVLFFDNEFRNNENELKRNFFDEIFLIYNQNKELFETNSNLMWTFTKIIKRVSNTKDIIEYLKKIINLNSNADVIATYNFFNNYLKDWSQIDYLNNSKKINNKLSLYKSSDLTEIKTSISRTINLGFISSDIRSKHSVVYFLKTIVTFYDKNKYKIFLYNNHSHDDDTIREFRDYVFKSVQIEKLNDIEVINLVRKDEIDIIIDLNGFSSSHRLVLLKNRLAPIQISWCGYTNTTGLDEMDYLITDKNLIKSNEENLFSEKLIYLSDIWNCHSGYNFKREFNSLPLKKKGYVTFGSFNNFRKINDDVIEVWSEILKKIKNSKLLLKTSFPILTEIYKEKFKKNNVLDSVTILPFQKNFDNHLDIYKEIDIALDTFPWNGVTTSFEAIWMGVPVITMKGYNFNSRCGESINKNIGLENLIAENKNEYIAKAVFLSFNPNELEGIRKKIFENALKTPLFDKKKFCNEFFSSLEKIYN